jgi:hypothetical protein
MPQNSPPASPILRELAELCLLERQRVDRTSIERDLGLPLPTEYEEQTNCA